MLNDSTATNLLLASKQLPLYGKRILVTAPRNYASRLSEEIIKKAGLPILMPTIETCYLSHYSQLDNALLNINNFNWIAFTSRNGIIAFFERLHQLNIPTSLLQNCRICALGKDVEILLSLYGKVDLIPAESSPSGIIAELAKIPQIHQQNILVPAPEVVGIPEPNIIPNFVADLQNLGMKVTRVPTYVTQTLDKHIYTLELNLVRQGLIDIIAFTSTAEVESFLTMVSANSDYAHCTVACFGPYTAANAEKLGVKVSIVSKDYSSFAGFVEAMVQFFSLAS